MYEILSSRDFGARLRLARESKRLSQGSLAEMVGAPSATTINKYENGCYPSCDNLFRLLNALEISFDELTCGETRQTGLEFE